jgi:hypothetical protein
MTEEKRSKLRSSMGGISGRTLGAMGSFRSLNGHIILDEPSSDT